MIFRWVSFYCFCFSVWSNPPPHTNQIFYYFWITALNSITALKVCINRLLICCSILICCSMLICCSSKTERNLISLWQTVHQREKPRQPNATPQKTKIWNLISDWVKEQREREPKQRNATQPRQRNATKQIRKIWNKFEIFWIKKTNTQKKKQNA